MSTLEMIRAKIKAKYDSIPWRDNDYNDGWVEALEWVYDDVIGEYAEQEQTNENLHREREQAYMQGYEDASKKYRQEPNGDVVSRQAVLDLINADWKYEGLEEPVSSLPSVRPQEQTNSKDIIWYDKRNYSEIVVEPQESEDKEI